MRRMIRTPNRPLLRLRHAPCRGQAMVELALVFPLFMMLLVGIIVLGMGVFYQQQVTNAAREAARYASVHSATAQCPVASTLEPASPPLSYPTGGCDRPADSWPKMTAAARRLTFGLNSAGVNVAACWSGYRLMQGGAPTGAYDAPPPNEYTDLGVIDSDWAQCTIESADPTQDPSAIACNDALASSTVDQASSLSEGPGRVVANVVSAYACYEWHPPMAGFLLIPETVTLRGVISEPIERQQ